MENVLTQESQDKVKLITDICDLYKTLSGQDIDGDQFDQLYDLSLDELLSTIEGIRNRMELIRLMENLRRHLL
jgi:hypothetical protein